MATAARPPPRRGARRVAPWLVAPVAVIVILLLAVLVTSKPSVDRVTDSPLLGKPAPDLVATGLDGTTFDLSAQRGRWVVVNYFAPWCIPCVQEHPELEQFNARHVAAGGDVTLVSIVFDDVEGSKQFFDDQGGAQWPVLTDPSGSIALSWGVAKVPETFIVDPSGYVRRRLISGVSANGLDNTLVAVAQELLEVGSPS